MSEQENKTPTAVEIERQLRELRQKELEQGDQSDKTDNTAEPANKLGIEKLKKSRKGMIIIIAAFVLLAVGLSVYYVPSIIRSMSSADEKPAGDSVATGSVKRQTGLSDDTDPFNAGQKPPEGNGESKSSSSNGKAEAPPESVQHGYSRALDVSYGGSSAASGNSSSASTKTANETNDGEGSNTKPEVQPVNAGASVSLSKITRVPYDPNLFIPENTAIPCSLDRRFISDLAGKLVCTVNTDIYSANGNVKLIEKGTAAYLMYKSGSFRHGQGAVFIMATKLRTRTTPFIDIPLIDTQASGALGEAGASGWIDTHFSDRFLGAMMVGMIPDFAQALSGAAKNNKDNQTDYTANSRQAFADIARESFSNSVNIPPTLYKNQGEIITLIVGQDLDFSGIYKLKMK
ncbi:MULTISPECIES: VirB10/TraB/TrbI family type IV secretion system protein [Yersiniaceae]|uniref:Type IV secretory pathway VirB10 component n=1 Tax=Yersinia intermedia TaxID=631 RepID=A0A0T9MZY7_YERIN|nr:MULTISPECIES: VirB10/TraB/TrbI family type IV secretion system protein [Yersiniaceae]CNL10714.1 type IV secretory pathway VirB10 component [Yersinia frederiksenii]HDL7347170.1 TrbI/VirB10 family protein [Yersinia enterocolitica]WEO92531.1 VirB10/TraB/TrbI family type IV secretion system protein [Serratia proteamaculans]CNG62296.1 type IV secretory pathway VirB10 component [Yersinia intermedia]CNI69895.1 type IV secretory pathway VirB10 component [Yersinia intermedia]